MTTNNTTSKELEQRAEATFDKQMLIAIQQLTKARQFAAHTEETGEVCTPECEGCNDPVGQIISELQVSRAAVVAPQGDETLNDYVTLLERNNEQLRVVLKEALDQTGCDGDLCNYRWHERARVLLGEETPRFPVSTPVSEQHQIYADGFCARCSELAYPLTRALEATGVPTGEKNWQQSYGPNKVKALSDHESNLRRLLNALEDGKPEVIKERIDAAQFSIEFHAEVRRRLTALAQHHKLCSAWTVDTGGQRKPCDCMCRCGHRMGEHARRGDDSWFEECANRCGCSMFNAATSSTVDQSPASPSPIPEQEPRCRKCGHEPLKYFDGDTLRCSFIVVSGIGSRICGCKCQVEAPAATPPTATQHETAIRWAETYAEGVESQNDVSRPVENWSDFHRGQVHAAKEIAAALRNMPTTRITTTAGARECAEKIWKSINTSLAATVPAELKATYGDDAGVQLRESAIPKIAAIIEHYFPSSEARR